MFDISTATEILKQHKQSHLLKFYETLDDEHRKLLLRQIEGLDFDVLDKLIQDYVLNPQPLEIPTEIQPPEVIPAVSPHADDETLVLHTKAHARGEELLRAGKVGAFTVAGGQGTRLGYEGPKGCLEVTPVVKKTAVSHFCRTDSRRSYPLRKNHPVVYPYISGKRHSHEGVFPAERFLGIRSERRNFRSAGDASCDWFRR